jgi:hypothetical protein
VGALARAALIIQDAKHRLIVNCGISGFIIFLDIFSQNFFAKKEKLQNIKCVFRLSL